MAKDYRPKNVPPPGAIVIEGTGPRERPPIRRTVPRKREVAERQPQS